MTVPQRLYTGPYRLPVRQSNETDQKGRRVVRVTVPLAPHAKQVLVETYVFVYNEAELALINKFSKLLKEMGVEV